MTKKKTIIISVIIITLILLAIIINIISKNKKEYKIEEISKYEYFILKEDTKAGIIDNKANTIIQPIYDNIIVPNPTKDIFICKTEDKRKVINSKSEEIFTDYQSVEPIKLQNVVTELEYEKSVLAYKKDNLYGLIDFTGNEITKNLYESIEGFQNVEGQLLVKQNGKYGIINIKGIEIVKPEYDGIVSDLYYDSDYGYKKAGYIVSNKENDGYKYGYISNKGKKYLDVEYNSIARVDTAEKGVYLIVQKNGQYGLCKNSKNVVPYEYTQIEYDNDHNILIVQRNKKYGAIDLKGNTIIEVENTLLEPKGEYLYAQSGDNRSVYDVQGNKLDVSYNKTVYKTDNTDYKIFTLLNNDVTYYGIMDNSGNTLTKEQYSYIEYAYNGYFIAKDINGKLGVINSNGKVIAPFKYNLVQKIEGKNIIQTLDAETSATELYSNNMKMMCSIKNANIINETAYIKVFSSEELLYFDSNGNRIKSSEVLTQNNLFAVQKDGKWGFEDKEGAIVVECVYDKVTDFNIYGYAGIYKDGKWGSMDSQGNVVVEPKYKLTVTYKEPQFIGKYYRVTTGTDIGYVKGNF